MSITPNPRTTSVSPRPARPAPGAARVASQPEALGAARLPSGALETPAVAGTAAGHGGHEAERDTGAPPRNGDGSGGASAPPPSGPTCMLLVGDRVVLRASGPPEAEYGLFELADIELRSNEPGRVREHAYQTSVGEAKARLAQSGVTAKAAHEHAAAMQPTIATAYARGESVRRVARYLGPLELFQSAWYDAATRSYQGVFLDLPSLVADLGGPNVGGLFQALYLAALLEQEDDNAPVVLTTDAWTRWRKPGERTYRRPDLQAARDVGRRLEALASRGPRPSTAEPLSRADVIAFVRSRADSAPDDDARALYASLERHVSERDLPERGPLADAELWAIESAIDRGETDSLVARVDAAEATRGRTPGTTYLRARLSLALDLEPARLVAERVSSLALSMTSFQELLLLAAEAWLEAGDPRRAVPYARDLVDAPSVDEGLMLRAQRILARAVGAAPARHDTNNQGFAAPLPSRPPRRATLEPPPSLDAPPPPPPPPLDAPPLVAEEMEIERGKWDETDTPRPTPRLHPPPLPAPFSPTFPSGERALEGNAAYSPTLPAGALTLEPPPIAAAYSPTLPAGAAPLAPTLPAGDAGIEPPPIPDLMPPSAPRRGNSLPPISAPDPNAPRSWAVEESKTPTSPGFAKPATRPGLGAPSRGDPPDAPSGSGLTPRAGSGPAPRHVPTPLPGPKPARSSPPLDERPRASSPAPKPPRTSSPATAGAADARSSAPPAQRASASAASARPAQQASAPPAQQASAPPAQRASGSGTSAAAPRPSRPLPARSQPPASGRPTGGSAPPRRLSGVMIETRASRQFDPRAEPDDADIGDARPAPPPLPPQASRPPAAGSAGPKPSRSPPASAPSSPPRSLPPSASLRPSAPPNAMRLHGASLPPYQIEDPPPPLPRSALRTTPTDRANQDELVEHLALPPGLPRGANDARGAHDARALPRSVVEARVAFTQLARELGVDYRRRRGIALRADVSGIEAMQSTLLELFPDRQLRSEDDVRELRRHGAALAEILARRLDAEWIDIAPSDLGHWSMIVPLDTRVWPFGRVARFVQMGHRERDLVSYFLELTARARA